MNYCYIKTPIGRLLVAGDERGLARVGLPSGRGHVEPRPDWTLDPTPLRDVERQVGEYFAGTRRSFELALAPEGTPFQLEVLDALMRIPFGRTRSYREIAESLGRPRAMRAVGAANGRNPLPILIPCHRVVGADGGLTGYAGGLDVKARLLSLEGAALPALAP